MDFGRVLKAVDSEFARQGIEWAAVGGVAVILYGVPRTTLDLDIAADGERQEEVLAWLDKIGYECLHSSRGFSNHVHPQSRWGRLDVIYLRDATRSALLNHCRRLAGPGGLSVPVVEAQHLIAMKAYSCKVDPGRRSQDLSDVRALARLRSVPDSEVREIFERYGVARLLEESNV